MGLDPSQPQDRLENGAVQGAETLLTKARRISYTCLDRHRVV
jgi:hypothetical protein